MEHTFPLSSSACQTRDIGFSTGYWAPPRQIGEDEPPQHGANPSATEAEAKFQQGLRHYYGDGDVTPIDWKEAERCFREARNHGHQRAQVFLCRCILGGGKSTADQRVIAEQTLEQAKLHGVPGAAVALAELYLQQRKFTQAERLLREEIDSSSSSSSSDQRSDHDTLRREANFLLSQLLIRYMEEPRRRKDGRELALRLADSGCPNSSFLLGLYYLNAMYGFEKDVSKGVGYVTSAAEKGHPLAGIVLSNCFFKGVGVTKCKSLGTKWLMNAVNRGSAEAETLFGLALLRGKLDWTEVQRLQTVRRSAEGEGIDSSSESFEDENEQWGVHYLRKAAENWYFFAQVALGKHYDNKHWKAQRWRNRFLRKLTVREDQEIVERGMNWYMKAARNCQVQHIDSPDLLGSCQLGSLKSTYGTISATLVRNSCERVDTLSRDSLVEAMKKAEQKFAARGGVEDLVREWKDQLKTQMTDYYDSLFTILSMAYQSAVSVRGGFAKPNCGTRKLAITFENISILLNFPPLAVAVGNLNRVLESWDEDTTGRAAQRLAGLGAGQQVFEEFVKETAVCLALVREGQFERTGEIRRLVLAGDGRRLRKRDIVREKLFHRGQESSHNGNLALDWFAVALADRDAQNILNAIRCEESYGHISSTSTPTERGDMRRKVMQDALGLRRDSNPPPHGRVSGILRRLGQPAGSG